MFSYHNRPIFSAAMTRRYQQQHVTEMRNNYANCNRAWTDRYALLNGMQRDSHHDQSQLLVSL